MYRLNPFTTELDFRNTPKRELREFFARFVDALPERTAILAEAVRSDDAFGTWPADLSPTSLEPLGAWFVGRVQTRPQTPPELAWTQARSLGPVSPVTLTETTHSVAADVGMYLGRVMTRLFPHLEWHLPLGGKTVFTYGQPVLKGFRPKLMLLPPVHIATVLAWKVAAGKQEPLALRRVLDVWSTYMDPTTRSPANE